MSHSLHDFTFTLADKDRVPVGTLTRVFIEEFKLRDMGGYNGLLRLRIPLDDPGASMLKEREMHYIRVCCAGTHIYSGFQETLERTDNIAEGAGSISIDFLPLGQLLRWREGHELAKYTDHIDDAMKDAVYGTCGAGAGSTPGSAITMAFTNFTIAADKHQCATSDEVNVVDQNVYERLLDYGLAYDVDFDCVFDEDFAITFDTWSPIRGTDRTQGNGANTEMIFSDADGSITAQTYGWDASNVATCVVFRDASSDEAASEDARGRYGLRIKIARVEDSNEAKQELGVYEAREYYNLTGFVELPGKEWITDWVLGDKVTWYSTRQTHGPHDEIVSGIDLTFDAAGICYPLPILGREKRSIPEKMRGGGTRGGGAGGGPGFTNPNPDLLPADIPAHDVLSATHDATTEDPTQGALIIGNSTPKWSKLAIGGAATFLKSNGTTASWSSISATDLNVVGANTQVIFNDGGTTLAGNAAMTFAKATGTLTATVLAVTANSKLSGSNLQIQSNGYISFLTSAGTESWRISTAHVLRAVQNGDIGLSTERVGTIYTTDANLSGDLTFATAKGIIHPDATLTGQVLRYNGTRFIPAKLAITDMSATHTHTVSITSGDNSNFVNRGISEEDGYDNQTWIWCNDNNTDAVTGGYWAKCAMSDGTHHHEVTGNTGAT